MTTIIINSLVVFALTLIVVKSKVLAGKREFVKESYEATKVINQDPGWVHRWWHALWTCAMCSGFWFAIPIAFFWPAYSLFQDVLIIFGINWLLHCLENVLFFVGEVAKKIDDLDISTIANNHVKQQESATKLNTQITKMDIARTLRKMVET